MPNWGVSFGPFSMGSNGQGNAPDSGEAAGTGGTGSLIGTNTLQTSIDKLDQDMQKLTAAVTKIGGNLSSNNGGGQLSQQQRPSQSQTMIGGMRNWLSGNSYLGGYGGQRPATTTGNGGGPNIPQFQSQTASPNGGAPNGGSSNSSGGMGSGPVSGVLGALGGGGAALGGAAMMGDALFGFGKSQLPNQVAMSSYAQTALLNGGTPSQIRYAAFGANGQNLNGLALNPQDAIAGQQQLNYIAGSGAVTQNGGSYQRGALGAAAMFGISNQGMSYGMAGQLAASMYAPQTSLNFMRYGFPVTPRMQGGGLRNPAQVAQGMIQGFYGRNSVNPSTLAFSLREGGNAQVTLQSMFGSQAGDWQNMLQAYNQVANNSNLNANQINSLFMSASRGSASSMRSAQQQLAGYHVNTSDIQSIKDLQSVKTGMSSDLSNSFNAGLQTSTQLLSQFNQILTKIVNIPGINQLVGGTAGFGGGLSSLAGGASLGMGAAGGSMLFKSAIGRLGGSAGGAGAASTATGDSALAAAAGGGGVASLGLLGPLGIGLGAGLGVHTLLDKVMPAGTPAGKVNSFMQDFSIPGELKALGGLGSSAFSGITGILGNLFGGSSSPNSQPNTPGGAASTSGTGMSNSKAAKPSAGGVSGAAKAAVGAAEQELGKPYVWGGDSPSVGFDCSGLVMWAYQQAGVKLPRTSQQQWAALKSKQVSLDAVQEGDIVFTAGSDGTVESPGHEALMISNRQLIQAPYTGTDVQINAYNPRDWLYAARPNGSIGTGTSGSTSSNTPSTFTSMDNNNSGSGNSGLGMAVGSYGSSEEIDNLTSALLGGTGGGVNTGFSTSGSASSSSTSGSISGGATSKGKMSPSQISQLWVREGGPSGAAANMARIAMAESGDDPSVKQQGQPPELTGWGLYQITPTSGINQNGQFGNLLNASNNTKAAISLYRKSGYSPWSADPVGASLTGHAKGTLSAQMGLQWVGERGPELKEFAGGEKVFPSGMAAHIAAQARKQSPEPDSLLTSPVSTTTGGSASQSVSVALSFAKGSIVIHSGLGSASAVSQSANEFISAIEKALQRQELFAQIASGANS